MRIFIYIAAILVLAAGCSRHIESENFDQNLPDRPPIPVGLEATRLIDGLILSWQVSDSSGIRMFRIYNSDSLNGNYEVRDSTSELVFSKTLAGLVPEHNYFFKVASVASSGLEGPLSSAISTSFGPLAIIINNDARYTRFPAVMVTFTAPPSASLVQLSEKTDFAGARWEILSPGMSKDLSIGDGVKRLFAKFQFSDGSESGGVIGDSIILDTRAAIVSVYTSPSSPVLQSGDIVTFYLNSGEPDGQASVSFSNVRGLKLYDNGGYGDVTAGDGIYTRRYAIPINMELVNGVITGQFVDAAGNSAEDLTFPSFLNITTPPETVILNAAAQSSSSIELTWSRSTSADFASYFLYRDTVATVSENSPLVTSINSQGTLNYLDANLKSNTTYFYRMYVYDNTGRSAGSGIESAMTNVNLPPTEVKLAARSDTTASILSWTTNNDDDFSSYQIYRSAEAGIDTTNGRLLTIINERSTTTFTDVRPDTTTVFYYKIFVYDKQGLATGSNEVPAP